MVAEVWSCNIRGRVVSSRRFFPSDFSLQCASYSKIPGGYLVLASLMFLEKIQR